MAARRASSARPGRGQRSSTGCNAAATSRRRDVPRVQLRDWPRARGCRRRRGPRPGAARRCRRNRPPDRRRRAAGFRQAADAHRLIRPRTATRSPMALPRITVLISGRGPTSRPARRREGRHAAGHRPGGDQQPRRCAGPGARLRARRGGEPRPPDARDPRRVRRRAGRRDRRDAARPHRARRLHARCSGRHSCSVMRAAAAQHPSVAAYPGLHTHRRALADGVRVHGCTVHFVTADLDHGPVVGQAAVPVWPDDDEAALAARVLAAEHQLSPAAVRAFCEGRLAVDGRQVRTHPRRTPRRRRAAGSRRVGPVHTMDANANEWPGGANQGARRGEDRASSRGGQR